MSLETRELSDEIILHIHKNYHYNLETGCITDRYNGKQYINYHGQRVHIHFCGQRIDAARLAWMLYYNEDPYDNIVDHIDTDPSNNRIDNLRLATQQQNTFNTSSERLLKGISKQGNIFVGKVCKDGQVHTVKSASLKEVVSLTTELREKLHGEFANHGLIPERLPNEQELKNINSILKLIMVLHRITP